MVLGPTARMWLPYLNFTVAISALGFQTAVLYPWHEELDKEFKVLKQEHREQLHLHQQVTIKKLEDLEKRLLVTEKAIPDSAVRMSHWTHGAALVSASGSSKLYAQPGSTHAKYAASRSWKLY
ncbi:hypothetical protein D6D01_00518 [Aureobasidium pullulans]|uniref:Mitochondrial phosphate carrier protein n=1 Tax=Aureobasidium pullulans TaxID=5580 RepID=A0A4S9M1R3_AURPU|nr:hypothetical protein D6D01_00518 [Aureobasidium pullulans]